MTAEKTVSRRNFLKTTGVVAAGLPVFTAQSYARITGANDRLNTAIIGCGGMAQAHLNALLQMWGSENVEILTVCDVYDTRAHHFQDQIWRVGGRTGAEKDYERVLENPDLDYVTIATPEHWHARMTLNALDAGLHVYCEKPMTHTVEEAHAVEQKTRETGLKVQIGVQGMSDDSYSSAFDAIRTGKIGAVIEAQIDYVRNYAPERGPWRTGVNPNLPKPADLDWDKWLGPARKRPWEPARFVEWRNYRDYSGGIASDLFIHRLTRILKACGLGYPTRVAGMGGIYLWDDGRELPDNLEMLAEYPAIPGITPGMTVHVLGTMGNNYGIDHVIRGTEATLRFTRQGWDIIRLGSGEVVESHQKTGGEDIDPHHRNHHAAIRDGVPLYCPVELGSYGVAAITGANQSWFEKKMLAWDDGRRRWR